jgi:hypothetical protein
LLRSCIDAASPELRTPWVSVRGEERDPQRFWVSVLDSLRQTAPGPALMREPDAARRAAMLQAIDLGTEVVSAELSGHDADPEARKAWQETGDLRAGMLTTVGLDGVEYAGIGSAPVSLDLMTFFLALGLPAGRVTA